MGLRQHWLLLLFVSLCVGIGGCGDGSGMDPDASVTDSSYQDGSPDDAGEDADSAQPDDAGDMLDANVTLDVGDVTDAGNISDAGDATDSGTADAGGCAGPDSDGDNIPDACDECALGADQLDADLDTVPDACDECVGFSDLVDADSDSVPDGCDVCVAGDDALDSDGDGVPNACDLCSLGSDGVDSDGDGVPNACDRCALGADQLDADLDTVPNACDECVGFSDLVDTDMDGVPDGCDICLSGDDAVDTDNDDVPDACDICGFGPDDVDADGDDVPNACDMCPGSPDGADADSDGTPDGCDICAGGDDDLDADGDDVPDHCDLCAGHDDAVDADDDGTADGCDCAPSLPDIHPGVLETCDGIDNNCTGGVDETVLGCPVFCTADQVDWDRDGLGCESTGRVIYVDENASGVANGTSWARAHRTIEAAILDAEATPAGRKQIWIADGEYRPTRILVPGTTPTRGFLVPASTALLGGFSGDEWAVSQADPTANDVTVSSASSGASRLFDVRQSDAVLDGMFISSVTGEAILVAGGALQASRLDINGAVLTGFGPNVVQVNSGSATLRDTRMWMGGIGLFAQGGTVVCERCSIIGNGVSFPGASGGGIVINNGNVTIRNSIVASNQTANGFFPPGSGGTAGGVTIRASGGRFRAENSTIAGNSGSRLVSGVSTYAPAGLDVQAGAATLVNSIVQFNGGSDTVVATIISSSVEGDANACAPLFTSGFHLGAGSLCIDAGDSSMVQGSVDLAGAPRIRGAAVDMGAYETQP